eukprot:Nk52_evm1s1914 gene=Nk52_evmTU1s1914
MPMSHNNTTNNSFSPTSHQHLRHKGFSSPLAASSSPHPRRTPLKGTDGPSRGIRSGHTGSSAPPWREKFVDRCINRLKSNRAEEISKRRQLYRIPGYKEDAILAGRDAKGKSIAGEQQRAKMPSDVLDREWEEFVRELSVQEDQQGQLGECYCNLDPGSMQALYADVQLRWEEELLAEEQREASRTAVVCPLCKGAYVELLSPPPPLPSSSSSAMDLDGASPCPSSSLPSSYPHPGQGPPAACFTCPSCAQLSLPVNPAVGCGSLEELGSLLQGTLYAHQEHLPTCEGVLMFAQNFSQTQDGPCVVLLTHCDRCDFMSLVV